MNQPSETFFAAVGDVHGHHHQMVRLIRDWESQTDNEIAFVLQVGDFEPHRDDADLETMAAPAKYKILGDFPDFYSSKSDFPWLIYFIGGNHEPYGFLDLTTEGGRIAENCFYMGRVGAADVHGLKVVGLSGVYSENKFTEARPPAADFKSAVDFKRRSNKDYIYFTKDDVDRALDYGSADILLLHDWPAGIIAEADRGLFHQQRRSINYHSVGNEYARILVELLSPRLVLCGHMHKKYRNRITLRSGALIDVCCLSNVQQGQDSVAFFRIGEDGAISEITG
ncbi:MAG: metallophosphoesterase [Acidobacteriota bacterium]